MARPKSPEKLLELAIANGDLEAAKAAMLKIKEKPKPKKPRKVSNDGAVILNIPSSIEPDEEFKTKESNQAKSQKLQLGVKTNDFKPGNLLLDIVKEDKAALKGKRPAQRVRKKVDISKISVTCSQCNKKYQIDKWESNNRKMFDEETRQIEDMEYVCARCIKE